MMSQPVMPTAGSGGAPSGLAGAPVQSGTGGGAPLTGAIGGTTSDHAKTGCSVTKVGADTSANGSSGWLISIALAFCVRRTRRAR
jgi:hypothetical protein